MHCVVCQKTDGRDSRSTSARSASSGSATTAAAARFGRLFCAKRCADQFFFGDDDDVGEPARPSRRAVSRRLPAMSFPAERPRRLRADRAPARDGARDRASRRSTSIYPLFVAPGEGVRREIASLPGCFHLSVDEVAREARGGRAARASRGVILFGLPDGQGPVGTRGLRGGRRRAAGGARDPRGLPDLLVITDVCLCEYTSHGHCGVVEERRGAATTRRSTLLARMAVSHAGPAPTSSRPRT